MSNATSTIRQPMRTFPRWMWVVIGIVILAAAVSGFISFKMSYTLPDLNLATTVKSEAGVVQGTYSLDKAITVGTIHQWKLHLVDASGKALENAKITVDGGMPQHGHGLPTVPQVTDYLGNGDYRVEGMKFNMSGWWVVKFHIEANGQKDLLTFNLILE
jgi:hypothetical protein